MSQIESIPPLNSWWLYELHSIQFLVTGPTEASPPHWAATLLSTTFWPCLAQSIFSCFPKPRNLQHHFYGVIFSFGDQQIQHSWFCLTFWSWDPPNTSGQAFYHWRNTYLRFHHHDHQDFFDLMTCLIRLFGIPNRNPGLRTLRALTAARAYRSPRWWCSSGSR